MSEPTYITVKVFTSILGILATICILGMTSLAAATKANNKLIYEHQLIIVESLGDIKSSIADIEK